LSTAAGSSYSRQLGHQSDAAAFLIFVQKDSGARVCDRSQRQLELLSAIAAQRVEDIAGEALRVDADDRRSIAGPGGNDVAHHQCDGGFNAARWRRDSVVAGFRISDDTFKAEDAKLPPACGEVGIGELANGFEGHHSIIRIGYMGLDVCAEGWMQAAIRLCD
jgi:hypothetical protein